MTEDGLKKVDARGVDAAYVRPGASLGTYKRILLDPVEVAFSKDWKPKKTGSYLPLSNEDREKIRRDLAELFTTTFTEVLQKGGYPVVSESGPDVLRVTAGLTDVYINAPDTMAPGRSYTFVMSAGHMTLVAELRDSETGQIMARVFDQRETRNDQLPATLHQRVQFGRGPRCREDLGKYPAGPFERCARAAHPVTVDISR